MGRNARSLSGLERLKNGDDVHQVVQRFRGSAAARSALEVVTNYWKHTLGA